MSNENVHIYLKKPDKDFLMKEATASEKYLILQNDTLHHEKLELTKLIDALRQELAIIENDNDRMEQGKTYMGGIIKNCVEFDKLRLQASDTFQHMFTENELFIKNYKSRMIMHTRVLQGIVLFITALFFEFTTEFLGYIIFTSTLLIVVSFQEGLIINLSLPEHTTKKQNLRKIQSQINDISVAQKHLDAYVEEL